MTAQLLAQEQAARAAEQQHAQALATIDAQYQENERHARLENNRLRTQLRAGTVRLSVPVVAGSCNLPADDSAAGSRNTAPRAELSSEAADDLVALADDADAVVRQLTACQAVIGEYLE
ncbi:lysis system i-spanin subunit Rz [Laribacter hongkongensis]|uniref:lysis system i-spanin subunit Rz n=1 Tax=Laribacter hongkongensis TaxID=168471 RepID=UPI001FD41708|nr:lysis system i-spanin subunit Rz [Laribacter hongkongensis]